MYRATVHTLSFPCISSLKAIYTAGRFAADGSKNYTPPRTFKIEPHVASYGIDAHLWKTGFASASHIDYFIHAPKSGKDSIIEQAVNSWNGISSKVYLHRDYSNVEKQLGIYENEYPPNNRVLAKTFPGGIDQVNYNGNPYSSNTVSYTEILLYYKRLTSDYDMKNTATHEVGHALSLGHTNDATLDELIPYRIDYSTNNILVPLIMNQGSAKSSYITTTDRDHLRIKWGN